MQQLRLRPQLVGHHLPVGAQQRPALHVHQLGAGEGALSGRPECHRAPPCIPEPAVGERRAPRSPAPAPPGGCAWSSCSALWPRSRSSGCSLWGWRRPARRSRGGTGHTWGPARSPGSGESRAGQSAHAGRLASSPRLPGSPDRLRTRQDTAARAPGDPRPSPCSSTGPCRGRTRRAQSRLGGSRRGGSWGSRGSRGHRCRSGARPRWVCTCGGSGPAGPPTWTPRVGRVGEGPPAAQNRGRGGGVWAPPGPRPPEAVRPGPAPHLHWPLSLSQVGSVSSWMPGPEQLHSSQPASGWQPKVRGWQAVHWGGTVRGGQMHWPESSSHRRPLQSQAAGSSAGLVDPRPCSRGPGHSPGGQGQGHADPGSS